MHYVQGVGQLRAWLRCMVGSILLYCVCQLTAVARRQYVCNISPITNMLSIDLLAITNMVLSDVSYCPICAVHISICILTFWRHHRPEARGQVCVSAELAAAEGRLGPKSLSLGRRVQLLNSPATANNFVRNGRLPPLSSLESRPGRAAGDR